MMQVLHMLRVNVFKFIVLMGTFALAMAFAGNDLVNFIGVPLAGMDSFRDYMANSNGIGARDFMMTSLMESAQTPSIYLLAAGVVMIVAMATSKKARNVIKTSVDLSRQDEGDEMFGSSRAARSIVRVTQDGNGWVMQYMPKSISRWIDSRSTSRRQSLTTELRSTWFVQPSTSCSHQCLSRLAPTTSCHSLQHTLRSWWQWVLRLPTALESRKCRIPRDRCYQRNRWLVHHRSRSFRCLCPCLPDNVLWRHTC